MGELDAFTVSQFRQSLAELAVQASAHHRHERGALRDSAGLGALIGGIRRARELGGDVVVGCNRPSLVRTLRTTGFDRIVTMTETVDDAKADSRSCATAPGAAGLGPPSLSRRRPSVCRSWRLGQIVGDLSQPAEVRNVAGQERDP